MRRIGCVVSVALVSACAISHRAVMTQDIAPSEGAVVDDVADTSNDPADDVADVTTCGDGGIVCLDACLDPSFDLANCGACGRACAPGANGSPACRVGACVLDCAAGFGDCDSNTANGCESPLATDTMNCGACGRACAGVSNGSVGCTGAVCTVTCNMGFVLENGACSPDPARARSCPGYPVVAGPGEERVVVNTTIGRGGDTAGTGACGNTMGEDAVFVLTASVGGVLYLRLDTASFDASLYVRSTCDLATSQTACVNDVSRAGQEALAFPVVAGATYFVFVDAATPSAGAFALRHRIGVCGDGAIDAGESCDDGNTAAMDGCSPGCSLEPTGSPQDLCDTTMNHLTIAPGRHAFRGTTMGAAGTLSGLCTANRGADVVYVLEPTITGTLRVALFPDSGFNGSMYAAQQCSQLATSTICSNRSTAGRWENLEFPVTATMPYALVVDTHDGMSGGYQIVFSLTRCGDGFPAADEQCDDGNAADGDGCSASCRNEAACVVTETEPNGAPATAAMTPRCGYLRVNGALRPNDDQDYTALMLRAGQLVELETFESGTGDCRNNPDTVVEFHRSPLAPAPGNNNCGGATGLACSDDQYGGLFCSRLRFAAPEDGTYFVRAYWYQYENNVAAYSLGVRTVR